MTYEMNSCPTCGSGSPIKIGVEEYDSHIFPQYRCAGCDTEFSALNKYKRTQAALKKKADEEAAIELAKAEEQAKLLAERLENPTTEDLLKQIIKLLEDKKA